MHLDLKNLSPEENLQVTVPGQILLTYRGSIAHGMYTPKNNPNSIDDKDLMGVFIAAKEHYLGFPQRETYERWVKEYDIVHYELRKLFTLLLKGNPNVLSLLWVKPKYVLYEHSLAKKLRENRDLFVTKKVYHSFNGYAWSQFTRMNRFARDGNASGQGYMGEKRKQLVEKFGFDSKNAAHCIRLLKMGIEFLTEGTLYVERSLDAPHLLAIKNGELSLAEVTKEAEDLFKLAQEAYVRSSLPAEPDSEKAEKFLISLLEEWFYEM